MVAGSSQGKVLRTFVAVIACFSLKRFSVRPIHGRPISLMNGIGVGSAFVISGFPSGRVRMKKTIPSVPLAFPASVKRRIAGPKRLQSSAPSLSTWRSCTSTPPGYTFVIVESPAKARTIQKFLDLKKYVVDSCMGHIRDLPGSAKEVPAELKANYGKVLGVDADHGFKPLYVILSGKEAVIKRLRKAQESAGELILATDEDREGEAISWHLLELLKPKIPVKRAVFHEITRDAITRAFESPRQLATNLVHAQEARRILDRLAGYTMSPLLWRKIAPSLSAGRVQSVGLALVVRRERERLAFVSAGYFDLKAVLSGEEEGKRLEFSARLVETGGKRVALGRDFTSNGTLRPEVGREALVRLDADSAARLAEHLSHPETVWQVERLETKHQRRKPPPPFITSTLQQEASKKLSMSSKETMRVAQSLYEAGYITYMRTDNPVLSESALALARECVTARYGAASLASGGGRGAHKPKGSQEAHEAIRPAVSDSDQGRAQQMRPPESSGLSGRELALYQLVFQRTLASVMVDAELELTSAHVRARRKVGDMGSDGLFRAAGKVVVRAGWMAAYQQVEEAGDEASLAGGGEGGVEYGGRLPKLVEGQQVDCCSVLPDGHETKPPARYTEASFVKELETLGIGRPSTYAQILDTLKEREYVSMLGKALVPSLTAFVVVSLLESHFKDFVDTAFTAKMEERLDEIAQGVGSKEAYLSEYYLGERGLRTEIQRMEVSIDAEKARRVSLPVLESEDAKGVSVFVGPYGAYVEKREVALEGSDEPSKVIKAKLPADICANVELLTLPVLQQCLNTRQGPYNGSLIGEHPDTGQPVLLKIGPFGPYIQLGEDSVNVEGVKGPKRVALPKGASMLDMNLTTALGYLSCPRVVCLHPESGEEIRVGIGRFGAFIQHKGAYKSLGPGDDVLTLDEERALQLVQEMGSAKSAGVICELGEHAGAKVVIMDGKYGPYIKWRSVNARIPAEFKEHPREVPLSTAVEAIVAKDPKASRAAKPATSAAATVRTRAKKPPVVTSKANVSGAAVIAKKAAKPRARATARKAAAPATARSATTQAATQEEAASSSKRPRNAYIIFCQEHRAKLASDGLSFAEITRRLSVLWKEQDAQAREAYEAMAELDRLRLRGGAMGPSDVAEALATPGAVGAGLGRGSRGDSPERETESGRTLGDGPGDDSEVGAMEREFAAVALGGAKDGAGMPDAGGAGPGRKRRPSAYILFCVEKRPSVAAAGLSFGDVARALSVLWRGLSDSERALYEEQARRAV